VPRSGPALFFDAEDDVGVIHRRLDAIRQYHNTSFARMAELGLHIVSMFGKDPVLAGYDRRSGRMEPTALYRQLLQMVSDIRPVITIIASSADVFAGNEIDRSQVQQFISLLTKLAVAADGAVILISHPSLSGISTDSGISGSTAWHNSVRSRMYLKGIRQERDEPTTDRRIIEFRKNNYGPVSEQIVIHYQSGLFLPDETTTVDRAARDQEAEDIYLEVLGILAGQGQDLSANRTSNRNYAAAMVYQHPVGGRFYVSQDEVEAAQQRLLDKNKVHIIEEGPPSRRRKRIVAGPGASAEATEEHPL
jgi:RecA-family ATPase